jgi:hypothetical protein
MKSLLLATTLASLVLGSVLPVSAMSLTPGLYDAATASGDVDKRRKPRVPGGSGCDDLGDIIEHPECRP